MKQKLMWAVVSVLVVGAVGCPEQPSNGQKQVESPSSTPGGTAVVATIGKGEQITEAQLMAGRVIVERNQQEMEFWNLRQGRLDELLMENLFKKDAGTTPYEQYVQDKIVAKVDEPSNAEIMKFMEQQIRQIPKDPAQVDDLKNRIRPYLKSMKVQEAKMKHLEKLKKKYDVDVHLSPNLLSLPEGKLIEGANSSFGKPDAKVSIIEFSDFECPYCSRAVPIVDKIKSKYGNKVFFQFRHLPLLGKHPNAEPAAVAAVCADRQGKFWKFHNILFENQRELNMDNIKKYAAKAGVNAKKFEECLNDPTSKSIVDKDLKTAEQVGIASTPTFIVNGKPISGALPFEIFEQIIDKELQ